VPEKKSQGEEKKILFGKNKCVMSTGGGGIKKSDKLKKTI